MLIGSGCFGGGSGCGCGEFMVVVVFAVQEFVTFAGHIGAEVQAIDEASVTLGGPLLEVVVDELGGGDPVGFNDLRLMPMGSVHEDARGHHETGVEGAAVVDHIEDMIFDLLAPGGQSFLELFGWPSVDVEAAIEDNAGIEDFGKGPRRWPSWSSCGDWKWPIW